MPRGTPRKIFSFSLLPSVVERVDRLRGDESRSAWIEALVVRTLDAEQAAGAAPSPRLAAIGPLGPGDPIGPSSVPPPAERPPPFRVPPSALEREHRHRQRLVAARARSGRP